MTTESSKSESTKKATPTATVAKKAAQTATVARKAARTSNGAPKKAVSKVTSLSQEDPRPLKGYAGILASYAALTVGLSVALRRKKVRIAGLGPMDLLLYGLATEHLSRVVTKDSVTAVLRAPFTHFKEAAGRVRSMRTSSARGPGTPSVSSSPVLSARRNGSLLVWSRAAWCNPCSPRPSSQ